MRKMEEVISIFCLSLVLQYAIQLWTNYMAWTFFESICCLGDLPPNQQQLRPAWLVVGDLWIRSHLLWTSVPVVNSCWSYVYFVAELWTVSVGLRSSSALNTVGAYGSYFMVQRFSACRLKCQRACRMLLLMVAFMAVWHWTGTFMFTSFYMSVRNTPSWGALHTCFSPSDVWKHNNGISPRVCSICLRMIVVIARLLRVEKGHKVAKDFLTD